MTVLQRAVLDGRENMVKHMLKMVHGNLAHKELGEKVPFVQSKNKEINGLNALELAEFMLKKTRKTRKKKKKKKNAKQLTEMLQRYTNIIKELKAAYNTKALKPAYKRGRKGCVFSTKRGPSTRAFAEVRKLVSKVARKCVLLQTNAVVRRMVANAVRDAEAVAAAEKALAVLAASAEAAKKREAAAKAKADEKAAAKAKAKEAKKRRCEWMGVAATIDAALKSNDVATLSKLVKKKYPKEITTHRRVSDALERANSVVVKTMKGGKGGNRKGGGSGGKGGNRKGGGSGGSGGTSTLSKKQRKRQRKKAEKAAAARSAKRKMEEVDRLKRIEAQRVKRKMEEEDRLKRQNLARRVAMERRIGLCRFHSEGRCRFGARCNYAHGRADRRARSQRRPVPAAFPQNAGGGGGGGGDEGPIALARPLASALPAPAAAAAASADADEEERKLCVICWAAAADWACVPCGHKCLCANCKDELERRARGRTICPRCRGENDLIMRVFEN
jgi:hypothetical protein